MADAGHLCMLTSCWLTQLLEDTTAGGTPSRVHGSSRYTTVKIVFFSVQNRWNLWLERYLTDSYSVKKVSDFPSL
jgi:hypothetical protein